jgi:hypothetical protein
VPDNEPSGTVTLDINNDGNLDVIAFNGFSQGIYEYLNTGDGSLKLQTTYQAAVADLQDMVVADFNHDGYADLAVLTNAPSGSRGTLHILFNNHAGGFTAGPTMSTSGLGQMTVGDYDGDGAADLAVTSTQSTYLYFGDNTGNFTEVNATTAHHPLAYLMDINGDGKSDLVGVAPGGSSNGMLTYHRDVWVLYGNSFRNIIEQSIPLNGYAVPWTWGPSAPDKSPSVDVADFNGDGLTDFAIVEAQNPDGSGTRTLAVKLNQLNYYAPETNVYSSSDLDFGVAAIRATDSLKPDLLVDTFDGTSHTNHFFVNDTTSGYFGGCEFPNTAIGIDVCSPTTYSSTSVGFNASAAGQTTMRKVEVWVDGVKKYQDTARHFYSHYGLLGATVTLSAGTHHVTILAAGYDNLEIKKSYTITVQ